MKIIYLILFIFNVILVLSSCKKDKINEVDNVDFYNINDRIGTWINSGRSDTLKFLDSSDLIRNSSHSHETYYKYRIDGTILYIHLPDSQLETEHPILDLVGPKVIFGNMYITTGFTDNSGTFQKIVNR
jgi:hypothetical protein